MSELDTKPLIAVVDLASLLDDPRLRVIDCRFELGNPASGEQAYLQSRIPGAQYVHLERDLSDMSACAEHGRHPLPSSEQLEALRARSDISPHTHVVAYDHDTGAYAARLWWLLRESGHAQVQVLDGGFAAWRSAGLPQERDTPRTPQSSSAAIRMAPLRRTSWLDADALQSGLDAGTLTLVDARAAARFRGDVEPMDALAGHVPGALNRPFQDNLGADGQFKPAARLREEFLRLLVGRTPDSVVHMCGSGVTACHNQLAMFHAGLPGSRLYADSWSGWITDRARPVATGCS